MEKMSQFDHGEKNIVYNVMRELRDTGISCFPLANSTKVPHKGFEPKIYFDRLNTDDEIDQWEKKYPYANLAIVTGEISKIVVIDIDGQSGEDWFWQSGIPESQYQVHTKKGRHLYYSIPDGETFTRMKRPYGPAVDADIIGNGYVVAPPSKVGGYAYKLATTINIEELPPLKMSDLKLKGSNVIPIKTDFKPRDKSIWDDVINGITIDGKPRHDSLLSLSGHFASTGLTEEAAKILICISADNFNKKDKSGGRKITHKEAEDCVKHSYNNELKKIKERGQRNPHFIEAIKNLTPEANVVYTEDGTISPVTTKTFKIDRSFPKHLVDNAGGIIKMIYDDYYLKAAIGNPLPALAIPAILVGLANICGFRIMTPAPHRQYPTMSTLLLAASGVGKDVPLRIPERMINAAFGSLEQEEYKGLLADEKDKAVNPVGMPQCASAITSAEALEHALKNSFSKRLCLTLDEFHAFAAAMSSKNGGNYATFTKILNQLLTKETNYTKFAADSSKTFSIPYWRLNMICASATSKFWNSIDENTAGDGLLGRMLICEDFSVPVFKEDLIDEEAINAASIDPDEFPEHILMIIRNMADHPLAGEDIGPKSAISYACTKESRVYLNKIKREFFDISQALDPNEQVAAGSLYNRAMEHVIKIATLRHESLCWPVDGYEPIKEIGVDSFEWAHDLVSYLMENTSARMNNDMSDSPFAKNLFRVRKNIKKRMTMGKPATNKSISNSLNLTGKDLKDVIDGLIRGEQVEVNINMIKDKEVLSYVLTDEGMGMTI